MFSAEQIRSILEQSAAGVKRGDICREYGISEATFYRWKAKADRMPTATLLQKVKTLEDENSWLKKIVAELTLSNALLRDELSKKERIVH